MRILLYQVKETGITPTQLNVIYCLAYKWAVQIIQTRQNGYPGVNNMELNDLFLIPIIDLCNHDKESSVSISPSEKENGKSI